MYKYALIGSFAGKIIYNESDYIFKIGIKMCSVINYFLYD